MTSFMLALQTNLPGSLSGLGDIAAERKQSMERKLRNSVPLAFRMGGTKPDVLLLIHGWGCDHSSLLRQQEFFAHSHTVLNVDLRGHGESGAPEQVYSVESYANDVAWLCGELGIDHVSVVGHSMGGAIALEMGYRYPNLVRAVAMIDTAFQAPVTVQQALAEFMPRLTQADYADAYRSIMQTLSLSSDQPELDSLLAELPSAPQHVLLSSLEEHIAKHDFAAAALGCTAPAAYIGAAQPLGNTDKLQELIPALMVGRTLGAGHFAPLLAADQVNAMLLRFLQLTRVKH